MRYWIIDFLDIIVFETDCFEDAERYYYKYFECIKGIYDNYEDEYILYNFGLSI